MRGGRAKGVVTGRRLGSLRVWRTGAGGGEEVLWDFSSAAASAGVVRLRRPAAPPLPGGRVRRGGVHRLREPRRRPVLRLRVR